MKFTVIWRPSAEHELARIWNSADNRSSVTSAADEIDKLLRSQPQDIGESREDGFRVVYERPLGVFYYVSADDRQVIVLQVWSTGD